MTKTKLGCVVGIYNKGAVAATMNGKATREYRLWKGLLSRCIPGGHQQTKNPSYIGCTVHQDFIEFQTFAAWCQNQIGFDQPGWELDKDVLIQGNKVYGPDTCAFVPRPINALLTHDHRTKGQYPPGVSWHTRDKRFQAKVKIDGVHTHLGNFKTLEEAHEAYKVAKKADICRHADGWKRLIDPRVYQALYAYQV